MFGRTKFLHLVKLHLQEDQYAKWMAACRLASKGRSLADSSYESEVQSIKSFLNMQKPAHAPAVSINPNLIDAQEYLAPRFSKKTKGKVSCICFELSQCNLMFYAWPRNQ